MVPNPDWPGKEGYWREKRRWLLSANEIKLNYCILVPGAMRGAEEEITAGDEP